jgi:hypothetical protein
VTCFCVKIFEEKDPEKLENAKALIPIMNMADDL